MKILLPVKAPQNPNFQVQNDNLYNRLIRNANENSKRNNEHQIGVVTEGEIQRVNL